jgi:hypothetical protein
MIMTSGDMVVMYNDGIESLRPGRLFVPEPLGLVEGTLMELHGKEILEPSYFNANIKSDLDFIIGRFRSFHDTHRAALAIHDSYRKNGDQYCVYLRSFRLAGMVLEDDLQGKRELAFAGADRDFMKFLKAALPPALATLSFVNVFEVYPSGKKESSQMKESTIPSLRLLSHNWKAVVREVIRGAQLVVLNTWGKSGGVTYEMELLSECGMEHRTIVTGSGLGGEETAPIGELRDIFNLLNRPHDNDEARALARAISSLSNDNFRQTNSVDDLSELPCWVVDRNIASAIRRGNAKKLARVSYENFIPSSLWSNWYLLIEDFPKLTEEWNAIVEARRKGEREIERIANAMYLALKVFLTAVTLERYHEMAVSLSIIAMAHGTITGKPKIMATCYKHAAQCAQWSGDSELTKSFTERAKIFQKDLKTRRSQKKRSN